MRLRVLDLHTPLFWLVCFAQRAYGEPLFSLHIFTASRFRRWGWACWHWEELPSNLGEEAEEGATP